MTHWEQTLLTHFPPPCLAALTPPLTASWGVWDSQGAMHQLPAWVVVAGQGSSAKLQEVSELPVVFPVGDSRRCAAEPTSALGAQPRFPKHGHRPGQSCQQGRAESSATLAYPPGPVSVLAPLTQQLTQQLRGGFFLEGPSEDECHACPSLPGCLLAPSPFCSPGSAVLVLPLFYG